MITDSDIRKIKKELGVGYNGFSTKQELKIQLLESEKRMRLEIRKDIQAAVSDSTNSILSALSDVIETFGTIMKDTKTTISEQSDILNEHEVRIEKLEKHIII